MLSYDYFKTLLNNRFHFIDKTSRIVRLWNDEETRERCIKQVYDYYSFWNGETYTPSTKKVNRGILRSINNKTDSEKLILLFQDEKPQFYITLQDGSEFHQIPTKNLLQLNDYKYIHKRLIIFNEFEYYPGEYEDSRFLYNSVKSCVLLDRNFRHRENSYLENNNEAKIGLGSDLILYKCRSEIGIKDSPFNSFLQHNRPAFLKGGIKINRKNDYLKGYGPSIVTEKSFNVIFEFRKYQYNPELADAGLYKVRTDNFKDFEFNIVERTEPLTVVQSKGKGWNLKNYSVEDNYDIEGYHIQLGSIVKLSPIRSWINAIIKAEKSNCSERTSILIKGLYNLPK